MVVKTIFYSYHLRNLFNYIVTKQKNLELKGHYFHTKHILENVKALQRAGLIATFKIEDVGRQQLKHKKGLGSTTELRKFDLLSGGEVVPLGSPYSRKRIEFFFKYIDEKPLFTKVWFYSSPGRQIFLTYKKLQRLVMDNAGAFFFISSSYGVIDSCKAVQLKIGGILLYKVY